LGDKIQIRPELIRPNQVINPMRGLWRRGSEMKMNSSFAHLCVDASTWNMLAISDLDVFESRGKLLGFVTRIHREGRRNFGDQKTDMHKELYIYQSTNTGCNRLITWISQLIQGIVD